MKPTNIRIPSSHCEADSGQWNGFDSPTECMEDALESAMSSLVTPDNDEALHAPIWSSPRQSPDSHERLRKSFRKHGNMGAPPSVYDSEPFAVLGSRQPYLIGLKSPGAYLSFMQADPSSIAGCQYGGEEDDQDVQKPILLRSQTAPPAPSVPHTLKEAKRVSRIPRWTKTFNIPLSFTPPPPNTSPSSSSKPSSVKLRTRVISSRKRCQSNALTFFAVFDPESGGMVPFKSYQLPRSHLLRPSPGAGLPSHPKAGARKPRPPVPQTTKTKVARPPPRKASLPATSRNTSVDVPSRRRTQSKVVMQRRKSTISVKSSTSGQAFTGETRVKQTITGLTRTKPNVMKNSSPSISTSSSKILTAKHESIAPQPMALAPIAGTRGPAAKMLAARESVASMKAQSAKPVLNRRRSDALAANSRKPPIPAKAEPLRATNARSSRPPVSTTQNTEPSETETLPSASAKTDQSTRTKAGPPRPKSTATTKATSKPVAHRLASTSSITPKATITTSALTIPVKNTNPATAAIRQAPKVAPKSNRPREGPTANNSNRISSSSEKTICEDSSRARTATPPTMPTGHTKSRSLPPSPPSKFLRPSPPIRSATEGDQALVAFPSYTPSPFNRTSSPFGCDDVDALGRILPVITDEPFEDEGFYEHPELCSPPAAFNIWDLPGHDDCDPHLNSRFSFSTTSTSNYVDIDFPVEESVRYFAKSALDKHAKAKRNLSMTSRGMGSSSTVNLAQSKESTPATAIAQVWRGRSPAASPPSAFLGRSASLGSPDKVRVRLPSILSKLKRGSRGKDPAAVVEVMTVWKEDML